MKLIFIFFTAVLLFGCTSQKNITEDIQAIISSPEDINTNMQIKFIKGETHNAPSFAIWVEDLEGNFIETLFVTAYVGTGRFGQGEIEPGKWKREPGAVRRPATLPYWAHKRNVKAEDGLYVPSPKTAVPDAISGATPQNNFTLQTGTKIKNGKYRLLMEINQPWDANKYWTNNKYPDDLDYFTSLQPALVYAVTIDLESGENEFYLNPIGHSHYSGKDGKLYTDLSTLSTAKTIAETIVVSLN